MGRRAKYLTQEAKKRASRERKAQDSRTVVGRIVRAMQNRVAYQKRIVCDKYHIRGEAFPIPPSINMSLLKAHAAVTFPTSFIFELAHRGELADTEFPDRELEKWNSLPPYTGLENKTHCWLSKNIQDLLDALHGKNLREQHDFEVKRIQRYKSMPPADFLHEVYQDLTFYLQRWEGANNIMEQFSGEKNEFKLGMQYVRWMARRSLHLWEDYQALKQGSDAILCDYVERWIHVCS